MSGIQAFAGLATRAASAEVATAALNDRQFAEAADRIRAHPQPAVFCRDEAEVFARPVGGGQWVSLGHVAAGALNWLPGGTP